MRRAALTVEQKGEQPISEFTHRDYTRCRADSVARLYRLTAIWISLRNLTGVPFTVAGWYFQSRAAASTWLS